MTDGLLSHHQWEARLRRSAQERIAANDDLSVATLADENNVCKIPVFALQRFQRDRDESRESSITNLNRAPFDTFCTAFGGAKVIFVWLLRIQHNLTSAVHQ
jgi:hypothetical protein